MKRITRSEFLSKAGRFIAIGSLLGVTGFLAARSFKKNGLCRNYDRCTSCRGAENCSLTYDIKKAKWKAK